MDVKRNIILNATATAAENVISKVDKQIAGIGSGFGKKFDVISEQIGGAFTKIGSTVTKALGSALSIAGTIATTVAAGVVAAFAGLSAFMLKFSGQLTAIESQFDAIFAERKDADAAINELMGKYDYTKSQTQKFLAQMGSKLASVVSQGQLMKVSKDAVAAAQRISSQFGISLEEAMNSVAMALQGNVRGLRRYGIQVDQILSASGKMSQILNQTAKYESAVEATKNTVRWQFDNIKNTITEKLQQVAQMIDPILAPLLQSVNNYLSSIDMSWMPAAQAYIEDFINSTSNAVKSAKPYYDEVVKFLNNMGLKILGVSSWKEAWERVKLMIKDVEGVSIDLKESFKELQPVLEDVWAVLKDIAEKSWEATLQFTKTSDGLQLFAKTFAIFAESAKIVGGIIGIVVESVLNIVDAFKQMGKTVGLLFMTLTGGKYTWGDKWNNLKNSLEKDKEKSDAAMDGIFSYVEDSMNRFGEIWKADYTQKFKVDPQIKDATDKADKAGQKVVDAIADGADKAAKDAEAKASRMDWSWFENALSTEEMMQRLTGGVMTSTTTILDFGAATQEVGQKISGLVTSASESVDKVKNTIGKDVNVQLDSAVDKLKASDYSSIIVTSRDIICNTIIGLQNVFAEQISEQRRSNEYLQNGVSMLKDISSNLVGVNAFA